MPGIVLDMEGVLHVDWRALPGAGEAVQRLRAAGIEPAILTNTTGRTRAGIAERLAAQQSLIMLDDSRDSHRVAGRGQYHVDTPAPGSQRGGEVVTETDRTVLVG